MKGADNVQNIVNRIIVRIRELPVGGQTTMLKLVRGERALTSREMIKISNMVFNTCKQQNIVLVPMPGYKGIIYEMPFYRKESKLNENMTQTLDCPKCGTKLHIDWSQVPSSALSAKITCYQCEGFEQILFNPYFVNTEKKNTKAAINDE